MRLGAGTTLAFAIGATVPVISQRLEISNLWAPILIAVVAGTLAGAAIPGTIPARVLVVAAFSVFGELVGLSIDAVVDSVVFAHDRSLIGIEWMIWGFLMVIATGPSAALGALIQKRVTSRGVNAV